MFLSTARSNRRDTYRVPDLFHPISTRYRCAIVFDSLIPYRPCLRFRIVVYLQIRPRESYFTFRFVFENSQPASRIIIVAST